jgi:hypothetical protein
MKIKWLQSGGIAGLNMGCEIETLALPPEEAAEVEKLVKDCGVLKSRNRFFRPMGHDLCAYSISVEGSEISYSVSFDDLTVPEGAGSLMGYLMKRSRPRPR